MKGKNKMSLARFVARDPYTPAATEEELEDVLAKIQGVSDWTLHSDGKVTLEYDRSVISDDLVEEALAGMGFQLKHIFDERGADETEIHQRLGH
jgi:hypothetical protein